MNESKIIIKINVPLALNSDFKITLEIPKNINKVRDIIKIIEIKINKSLNPYELLILCEDRNGNVVKVLYLDDEVPADCVSVCIYPQPSGG